MEVTKSRPACFVLGVATAWALPWAYRLWIGYQAAPQRPVEDRDKLSHPGDEVDKAPADGISPQSASISSSNKPRIMDAADLDLRMIRKAEGVIRYRTSGITIVIERCTNDWNYSAILRTAEALGVQNVYIVDPPLVVIDPTDGEAAMELPTNQPRTPTVLLTKEEVANRRAHHLFAQNATDWLTITNFRSSQICIDALRSSGHTIWATDLSQEATPLTPEDLTAANAWPIFPEKLALVFGTEAVGVSQVFLQQADRRVYLPLYGFADSLNLSVATALVIFAILQMEPRYVGHMTEEERHALRSAWFPKLAQQRLLTSSQKKRRNKLLSLIHSCKVLEERQRRYHQQTQHQQDTESVTDEPVLFPLTNDQVAKLGKLSQYELELNELENSARFHEGSRQAVADLVRNPPEPLTDLRRIDQHRICFVGKNTKSLFKEAWKGLAATTTKPNGTASQNQGSTAMFFRSRAAES